MKKIKVAKKSVRPPYLWDAKMKRLAEKVKRILDREEKEYGDRSSGQTFAA
jgi:hypothetical protein